MGEEQEEVDKEVEVVEEVDGVEVDGEEVWEVWWRKMRG